MRQGLGFAALCFAAAVLAATPLTAAAETVLAQSADGSGAPPQPAPSGGAPAQPPAPATLTGIAAWNALRGNTINGSTPDGAYIEYFAEDGSVVHVDRDGKDSGQWKLREPTVCFTYPDDDAEDCRTFEVVGSKGTFIDVDGSRYHFDIAAGNPNHF